MNMGEIKKKIEKCLLVNYSFIIRKTSLAQFENYDFSLDFSLEKDKLFSLEEERNKLFRLEEEAKAWCTSRWTGRKEARHLWFVWPVGWGQWAWQRPQMRYAIHPLPV